MNAGIKSYTYTLVLDRDPEAGGYVAIVPALPAWSPKARLSKRLSKWPRMLFWDISKACRTMALPFRKSTNP